MLEIELSPSRGVDIAVSVCASIASSVGEGNYTFSGRTVVYVRLRNNCIMMSSEVYFSGELIVNLCNDTV